MASRLLLAILICAAVLGSEEKMAQPKFAQDNQLLRPEGYREWIFAGSSLGMGYTEGQPAKTANFHNVYIQPEAYRAYAATGKFPDKTMLVMEVLSAGTNQSINKNGHFED